MTRTHDVVGEDRPTANVAATYDRLAARWDSHVAPSANYPVAAWIRRTDRFLHYGESIVDLGCGTATPAAWILTGRYRYVGVDVSAGMVACASVNAPACPIHNLDMVDVSFADGGTGAVLCLDAINHVPRARHAALFRSIHRGLRAGGVLIANFHTVDVDEVWEPSWLNTGPMYWSSSAAERTLGLLETAGFAIAEEALLSHVDYDGIRRDRLWVVAQRTVEVDGRS